eukprot:scaffold289023_cov31-Prasinocladus_malaysianus.AAC.1
MEHAQRYPSRAVEKLLPVPKTSLAAAEVLQRQHGNSLRACAIRSALFIQALGWNYNEGILVPTRRTKVEVSMPFCEPTNKSA